MKKLIAWLLLFVMALTPCIVGAEETAEKDENTLIVGSTTAVTGAFFTDMWGTNTSDMDVRRLVHGYNLVTWDYGEGYFNVDSSVVSSLVAQDHEDGARTYTMTLYDDLFYSDGTQITAKDYAFSVLLTVDPEMKEIGGAADGSRFIEGADEYASGEAETLTGVNVVGDFMLKITVKAEYRPFFYEMGLLSFYPYPISVIAPGCEVADDGEGVYIRNRELFTSETLEKTILDEETGYLSHPSVTSGPYVLTSFDGDTATFAINPYFKGTKSGEKPSIETLIFENADNETMVGDLSIGNYDLLNKVVSKETIDTGMKLIATGDFSMSNYMRTGLSMINFCCEQTAVSSASVRQAIAYCFDKDAFIEAYVGDYGMRTDGYYGMGQWMVQVINGTMAAPMKELAEDATAAEKTAYEKQVAQWGELTLDSIKKYDLNVEEAVKLLEADGWTLNSAGEAYTAGTDEYRCKEIDGEIVALDLTMIYPEGVNIGDALEDDLVSHLKEAGIRLTCTQVSQKDLFNQYYRHTERNCHMIWTATNFNVVFDPSSTFSPDDAAQGISNRTGIADEELYELAVDMRKTESDDTLGYVQKWLKFQERYVEVMPSIPVYSNVYFDFYNARLHNYNPAAGATWGESVVGAYLSDVAEDEATETAEDAEGTVEIP